MIEPHHSLLEQTIAAYYPLSTSAQREIISAATLIAIAKNQSFIHAGTRDTNEYFLLEGVARSCVLTTQGDDVTISFYQEKSILPPNTTRTIGGRSTLDFESLTPITLASVDVTTFSGLMRSNREIYEFGHRVMERELQRKSKKEIGLASLAAKDRLLELRKDYPMLENQAPHAAIASYLGITNISLSRLRKELASER